MRYLTAIILACLLGCDCDRGRIELDRDEWETESLSALPNGPVDPLESVNGETPPTGFAN